MKNILRFLIAISIIVGAGYLCFYAYTTYAETNALVTNVNPSGSFNASNGIQVLSQLQQLSSLTLSSSIFQSPAFLSLVDFTVPVVPEPISRPNPFAPIGQD
jgi:hypothetical protein